jgi:ABC-type phosphate/phosphonate transport system substrate-binding protein
MRIITQIGRLLPGALTRFRGNLVTPLQKAKLLFEELQKNGNSFGIERDNLLVRGPLDEDTKEKIRKHKTALWGLTQRETLRRLLQVLDMSELEKHVPLGVLDDYLASISSAKSCVGQVWEN